MIVATAVLQYGWHVVVQQFVEHHGLHEKPWNPGLIENGVDPNQPLLRKIGPELQGALPSLGSNALAPSDADIDRTAEMPPRQVIHHRSQIMVTPFGTQLFLWRTVGNESQAMVLDETVDHGSGPSVAIAQVVAHRDQDILIGGQKHVVKTDFEPTSLGSGGQHGASVISDHETNGLPQTLCQGAAPAGRARKCPVQIVFATLGNAVLRDRRHFAGKLEGKLSHATWG